MIRIYAILISLTVAAALLWWYGGARYNAGYAAASAEQAAAVSAMQQRMVDARTESAQRLTAAEDHLRQREVKYDAELARLKTKDDSFRAWLEIPVHPAALDLIRGLRNETAANPLPTRPHPDP